MYSLIANEHKFIVSTVSLKRIQYRAFITTKHCLLRITNTDQIKTYQKRVTNYAIQQRYYNTISSRLIQIPLLRFTH